MVEIGVGEQNLKSTVVAMAVPETVEKNGK